MSQIFNKLQCALGAQDTRRFYGVVALAVVGMLLEMVGLGSIPVFLSLLTGDASGLISRAPSQFRALFDASAGAQLLVVSACALFGLFLVKNLYLAFVSHVQARFIWSYQARLAQRLFRGTIEGPWGVLVQRNSADTLSHSSFEAMEVAQLVLRPICTLVTEGLVVAALLVLLIVWEPVISAVAAAVLLASVLLFLRFSRRTLDRFARELQEHRNAMLRILQDAMGGAKVLKVLGRESQLCESFAAACAGHARAARIHQFTVEMPRLFVETAAVLGLVIVALLLASQGRDMGGVVPTLALLAVALVRLLPSFNRMTIALTSLRYGFEALNAVAAELRGMAEPAETAQSEPVRFAETLCLENVSFRHRVDGPFQVRDLSIEIPHGSVVGLMGESASGKTTLVDLVVGLLQPAHGRILVDGRDLRDCSREWQEHVGYVPQEVYIADDSVRRNVALGLPDARIDEVALRRAMVAAHMEPMLSDLPQGAETIVGERGARLSGGQRQRIGIARALYHDPDLLVFDEATSALDLESESCILETIADLRGKKTILLVAHRHSTVRDCDVVYRMAAGRVSRVAIERAVPASA
jgi:ATP-binding cassette, subfamily B, bacterial PglK